MLAYLALTLCLGVAMANNNLRVAYEWREIDFKYESYDQRWQAIEAGSFKPANVIPYGLEVYRSRLFITLPRWRAGVPATLAYLDLNDTSTQTPALTPFLNWQSQSLSEENPELVSTFRVRADRCGRLWVLDSRISSVLEQTKLYGPAQLLIYDLHNDNLLRRHVFPAEQMKQNSFFANLAVEGHDCENTYAYAADLGSPGLVVYSWRDQESWRVQHHFFHPDPMAGNFSINGIEFQWDDGLYGLALSKPETSGFSTLYFHPLTSSMEFSVNTSVLRNKTLATSGQIYREFKVLGSRGTNGQAGAQFLDQETGVLFYTLPNMNAVDCWKTSDGMYTEKQRGRVYMDDKTMVFPSDIKVDDKHNLWVLSNQLQEYIYDELYPGSVNFRILTGSVQEAIKNTACDTKAKPFPELINKLGDILNPVTNTKAAGSGPRSAASTYSLSAALISCLLLFARLA
ncbi:protein yellow [Scaptodrosophila lebanonensis]|uniref:Protein yellow n=1 Tax=Drosophila lebanonensis TaxID=7225 RepID=A0A6J2U8R8_DROLE|nr:protein yellow [Scaptodrosophila lebanonensis]